MESTLESDVSDWKQVNDNKTKRVKRHVAFMMLMKLVEVVVGVVLVDKVEYELKIALLDLKIFPSCEMGLLINVDVLLMGYLVDRIFGDHNGNVAIRPLVLG
jgi:uncharacterized membrane protein (DUF485 family)